MGRDFLGSEGAGSRSLDPRPSPVAAGLGTLCRTLVPPSCSQPCQLQAGSQGIPLLGQSPVMGPALGGSSCSFSAQPVGAWGR